MTEDLLARWDGEEVLAREDPSGARFLVAIHSTALGPAAGGTRMKVYASADDARRDAMRLAHSMSRKNAVAGLPLGGGKAVLAVPAIPTGAARRELLLRYGAFVESIGGRYVTACDMNTASEDMDVVGEVTRHVFGRTEAAGGSGRSAPATALGVFHGIRAALGRATGSEEPAGRTVAIQGVGAVGSLLARHLRDAGAEVVVADADGARSAAVATAVGARAVPAEDLLATPCDVLAPCATGGVLSAASIPTLRCSVVAGAANNQLLDDADGDRFADRGILYAPDFVVNAGGIVHLASLELLGEDRATLDRRLADIATTVGAVLDGAAADGVSTTRAAIAMADERIAAAR
ncbi:MAG: Glu/Leu/Phe/Val family dehydrogenase [Actinomycetota bacterium]